MNDVDTRPGILYLIPVPISDPNNIGHIPEAALSKTRLLRYFIAENAKSARKYLKILGIKQSEITVIEIDKHALKIDFNTYFEPVFQGNDVGLLSEAGMPAIADPGAEFVAEAHKRQIKVVPLTGPSSLLLALSASGMSGQHFSFNGYLPKEKEKRILSIKALEKSSSQFKIAQLFIETPYRNVMLFNDFLNVLLPETRLCVAIDITGPDEFISTKQVKNWKKTPLPDLKDKPSVFIFQAG
ncbi:MAG TPA: SAM-dependent methyltransferase [Bacteroidia bacterium]|nr:SAM-dependent methyltransferase [Bacteroidia bacterium]